MPLSDATYAAVTETAKASGREGGRAAAAAYVRDLFGRRNPPDMQDIVTAQTIVDALSEGGEGPSYLEGLPWCDLSGQWADTPSSVDVWVALCSEVGADPDEPEDASSALDAYQEAWDAAVLAAVEDAARAILREGA